jgi:type II secretory pathway component PulJ
MALKKRRGYSLVEVLLALCILGAAVPAALNAFGVAFMSEIRLRALSSKAFGAEWWFNRLDLPVSLAALDGMPRTDESGRMRFSWETENESSGALRVTLSVSDGARGDVPLVMSRVCP